jgi:hypothetical protein
MSSPERQAGNASDTRTEYLFGICGLFVIGLIGALYDLVERFH